MGILTKARRAPGRLVTGAFILNSGLTKRETDDEGAKGLHQMASGTYPPLSSIEPRRFAQLLSAGEIVLGSALLAPVVPAGLAGIGLTAFTAGLLGLYVRTPGMRQDGSVRPTQQGTALAKDVWMLGIGVGLMADALSAKKRGG